MKDINTIADEGTLLDGRYELLRPLSKDGGTADVWLAIDRNTVSEIFNDETDSIETEEESGVKVAIKVYRAKNALDLGEQRFRDEFKIVINCNHTNLIHPINFSIYEGTPYLVLPYCSKGSSEQMVGQFKNKDEIWRYIHDVAGGLSYLHALTPPIVHHDIKPANVLIDDNNNFAITDFGISAHKGIKDDGYDFTQSGTMAYMAPERFGEDYQSTPESDIWSFGATLYELVTGRVPFGEDGGAKQAGGNSTVPPINNNIPKDIKQLIYDCLSLNPSKRPTAKRLLQAANEKSYAPFNIKKYTPLVGGALLVIIALILVLSGGKKTEDTPVEPTISTEEIYENALSQINLDDVNAVEEGMRVMDSLATKANYVPALNQAALTYGWFSDPISLKRKDLLGIEYGNKQGYLPNDDKVSLKAIGYLSKIIEIGDDAYPGINAEACYRLACYYDYGDVIVKDPHKAISLLEKGKEWAEKDGDTEKAKGMEEGIKDIKKKNNI